MKTHRYLWPRIVSFDNLLLAYRKAARDKRFREDVAHFSFSLESNLVRLRRELADGTYLPGEYRHFPVYDRKPRIISAAPFRDRVVHHALCNVLEPIFEPTFIHDSYASRKGKGIHGAADRFSQFARAHAWVLRADIQQYFPSIDHAVLLSTIAKKIACPETLRLCRLIVECGTPPGISRGLPIGNQTSQFFSNVYLNPLDHFVLEHVRPGGYIRYVDDFVLFAHSKHELWAAFSAIAEFLGGIGLCVPDHKRLVQPVAEGTTFLGYRIWPHRRRLVRSGVIRFQRRYRRLVRGLQGGTVQIEELRAVVAGWLGHACHADTDALVRDALRG